MIVNVRNSSTFEEAKGGGLFHGFTKQILRRGVLVNVRVVIEVKHIFIWLKSKFFTGLINSLLNLLIAVQYLVDQTLVIV